MSFIEDKIISFMKSNGGITVKTCQEKLGKGLTKGKARVREIYNTIKGNANV